MKKIYLITTMMSLLTLISCNDSRVGELESTNQQLEQQIIQLRTQNRELQEMVEEMQNDMFEIKRYASSASDNANTAAFWSQSGNAFLFESHIRNMSSDFSNISRIASKY